MEPVSTMNLNYAGKPAYAKVHILDNPFSIDGAFHYYVPPHLMESVASGVFVTVPFGRGNRRTEGVVLSVEAGDTAGLKAVAEVLDAEALVSPYLLRLAAFVRERLKLWKKPAFSERPLIHEEIIDAIRDGRKLLACKLLEADIRTM